jgi:hypothetical protein
MPKNTIPKRCPLACWDRDYDENNLFDKQRGICHFPVYYVDHGVNGVNCFCDCPEVLTTAPPYTSCLVFSMWFWDRLIKEAGKQIAKQVKKKEAGESEGSNKRR